MRITSDLTDDAVLAEMGARLARLRLERNLTQAHVAEDAGVDRRAVANIEAGESVRLTTFVRVLRAMGLLAGLDVTIPPPTPSPIELLEREGRQRKRARQRPSKERPGAADQPWRWGDER